MNQLFSLPTALCLPVSDIEALIQGQTVVALSGMFIRSGQRFGLYPTDNLLIPLSIQKYYRPNFLSNVQTTIKSVDSETFPIRAWASCEFCQILDKNTPLDLLSQLTIWTVETFEMIIQKQQNIFLAYLRVYHLAELGEIPFSPKIREKIGRFVSLSKTNCSQAKPVLTTQVFNQRKKQLENLEPPLYSELEDLQNALASIASTNTSAQKLENKIKMLLYGSTIEITNTLKPDMAWINTIIDLGNRSIREDEGKSNYQAGTDFENIVRKGLEFLGFTIDYSHKGGAGGLDLFCSQPYLLVGECKSGRTIPNDTAVQLLNLGTLRLKNKELINQSVKLIIGPGKPTTQLEDAAKVHNMAIINPETLEKLVKLQSNYPNSIDLFELKKYLKPGRSDEEIEKYVQKVEESIKLRSQIISVVKELSAQNNEKSFIVTEIRTHYNVNHNPKLTDELAHDFLVELSSPLTGYLGREKGNDWKSDRFYHLRDLKPSQE